MAESVPHVSAIKRYLCLGSGNFYPMGFSLSAVAAGGGYQVVDRQFEIAGVVDFLTRHPGSRHEFIGSPGE